VQPEVPARDWRVAGRVGEGGSVFVCGTRETESDPRAAHPLGLRDGQPTPRARPSRSRKPPMQAGTRWSLPLPLASTLADTAEAPLGTFAACEETRC
jgi:hypothetical protein